MNKAAAEAAKWAQNQETVNVDVHAFDEAQAADIAERLQLRSAMPPTVSTATKKKPNRPNLQKPCSTAHTKPPSKKPCALPKRKFTDKASAATWGNAAPNECTPEFLARTAKAEAEKLGAHAKNH